MGKNFAMMLAAMSQAAETPVAMPEAAMTPATISVLSAEHQPIETIENADLPLPVEPVPEVVSKTDLKHSFEESGKGIRVSKTDEPSSVTQPEAVFKIPFKLAPKRKHVEDSDEHIPKLPRIGSAALPSSNLAGIEASSSSSSAGNSSTSDLSEFGQKYYKTQVEFVNLQMANIHGQMEILKNGKRGTLDITGMKELLDEQSRLNQQQIEWLNVRNQEEYNYKEQQEERNDGDPQ